MPVEKYVTRKAGVELVRTTLGIPLSKSTVEKDACLGRGPKPAAKYGSKCLYHPEEFLRYARERLVKCSPEAAPTT
jgi:hypothetical protein